MASSGNGDDRSLREASNFQFSQSASLGDVPTKIGVEKPKSRGQASIDSRRLQQSVRGAAAELGAGARGASGGAAERLSSGPRPSEKAAAEHEGAREVISLTVDIERCFSTQNAPQIVLYMMEGVKLINDDSKHMKHQQIG